MGNRRGTHLKCSELLFRKAVLSLLWFDEDLTHVGCCISRCNHYRGPSLVGKLCFPSSEFKISFSKKIIVFSGLVPVM